MTDIKNLGTVRAIHIGTTPPSNTKLLWYDTNTGVNLHKYWDTVALQWTTFLETLTPASAGALYYSSGSGVIGDADNMFFRDSIKTLRIGDGALPTGRLEINGLGNTAATQSLRLFKNNGDINIEFFDDGSMSIYDSSEVEKFNIDPNQEVSAGIDIRTTQRMFSDSYSGKAGRTYIDFTEHDSQVSRMRIYDGGSVLIQDTAPLTPLPLNPNSNITILDLVSTTKGFMLPRMTEAQRTALPVSPAENSLLVYQTNNINGLYMYKNGTGWVFIA